MLPKEKKQKKGTDKDDKEDKTKRRNSLTDNSSTSTSSNSSTFDSDEASSSSGSDTTKGTMTSVEQGVPTVLPSNGTVANESGMFRRAIRTDTPVEELVKDLGFTSLSDQYPLANAQPLVPTPAPVIPAEKPVARKAGKATNKKKKEKKDKKKEKEFAAAAAATRNFDPASMLQMNETARLKKEVCKLYNLQEDSTTTYEMQNTSAYYPKSYYASSTSRRTDSDKLKATVGLGVAATGVYDKVPEISGARSEQGSVYKGGSYTDLVGVKRTNWRADYEEIHLKEVMANAYGVMNLEWESVVKSRENLKRMVNETVSNKWMKKTLLLILDGDIRKVWNRIETIQCVLKARPGQHPYTNMGRKAMVELVVQGLVNMLTEPHDSFNVIMYLVTHSFVSSTGAKSKELAEPCFYRQHSDCMLAEIFLNALPPIPARRLLAQTTFETKRRAIHYAAIAGTPCQMDMLLKFGVNTNIRDTSGRAPIHYAIARNNTQLLRQLMWHGSDLSLIDPETRKMPVDDFDGQNLETVTYLQKRIAALERCMGAWIKALCGGKWKLGPAVTALHCSRIAPYGDQADNCYETMFMNQPAEKDSARVIRLAMQDAEMDLIRNSSDSSILLFILPVMFNANDAIMPAENPHIVRVKMAVADSPYQQPARVMSEHPTVYFMCDGSVQNRSLVSVFREHHNGYIYAYKFPKNIDANTTPTLSLSIDSSELGKTAAHHTLFLVQAYAVNNFENPKQKSD